MFSEPQQNLPDFFETSKPNTEKSRREGRQVSYADLVFPDELHRPEGLESSLTWLGLFDGYGSKPRGPQVATVYFSFHQ